MCCMITRQISMASGTVVYHNYSEYIQSTISVWFLGYRGPWACIRFLHVMWWWCDTLTAPDRFHTHTPDISSFNHVSASYTFTKYAANSEKKKNETMSYLASILLPDNLYFPQNKKYNTNDKLSSEILYRRSYISPPELIMTWKKI